MLRPGLYVITDRSLSRGRSEEEVVAAALRGGACAIQLREKRMPRPELLPLAQRLCNLCHDAGSIFIVNDDPELAVEAGADGVHLGPEDTAPDQARRILGPNAVIGWSVKGSPEMARRAAGLSIDYVAVGSIYPTTTKAGAAVVGVDAIGAMRRATRLPIAAIGGISLDTISAVIEAGADLACVVSAVVGATDVEDATSRLVDRAQEAFAHRAQRPDELEKPQTKERR